MVELSGRKILVVEDNKMILRQLTAILHKYGAKVFQASNGLEGCQTAEAEMPDVILMDVQMPVMDGYEATSRLKETATTSAIPIIMLTGNKDQEDVERGLRCGAVSYLTKPAPGSQILEAIRSCL